MKYSLLPLYYADCIIQKSSAGSEIVIFALSKVIELVIFVKLLIRYKLYMIYGKLYHITYMTSSSVTRAPGKYRMVWDKANT